MKVIPKVLLRVEGPRFVAGAVWSKVWSSRRREMVWIISSIAPILHWMHGFSPETLPNELHRRGCQWKWLKFSIDKVG